VLLGRCGQREVALGSAPAKQLKLLSFADVLDESEESGYQRPYDVGHAREFRAYIEQPTSTTIPLTFNLRGPSGWLLRRGAPGEISALLIETPAQGSSVMAQVDGQHRLGEMGDSDVSLAFQCFLGLSPREEMAIFSVINSKARGLSPSLLDYHATKLAPGFEDVQLELYIAKRLNDDRQSVWHGMVKLGGVGTQGTHRRVSLRGLQTATLLLLKRSSLGTMSELVPQEKYKVVRDYWAAVALTWPDAWSRHREHLLAKGVGVNALALLGAEVVTAILSQKQRLCKDTFVRYLSTLGAVDWRNDGPFRAFGGRHGADEVHRQLASKLWAPGIAVHRAVG
jgi:DNA sulfur modification protein DndB